jgi:prolyl oligopeptidase
MSSDGRWRRFVVTAAICGVGALAGRGTAQTGRPHYPQPPKTGTVDDYFGTKVADPYRWMENLNSPELKKWVDEENSITSEYLVRLPMRDALRKRITELWNYPKVTLPRYEGRRWFYSRNTGLQRQSVVFTRETLAGTEAVAIDPNGLWPDGDIALSSFDPAPDGQYLAYGQSEGGRTGPRFTFVVWMASSCRTRSAG